MRAACLALLLMTSPSLLAAQSIDDLIALNALRVAPDSNFSVTYTAFMIFVVVIGGIGSVEGPVIGAVVFFVLQQQFAQYGTWYLMALGAAAIIAVLTVPGGLWGLVSRGRLQVFPVGYRARIE